MTIFIYLDSQATGGQTHFPKCGLHINPEAGKLVMWSNVLSNGQPDRRTVHAGLPVNSRKMGLNIWIELMISSFYTNNDCYG